MELLFFCLVVQHGCRRPRGVRRSRSFFRGTTVVVESQQNAGNALILNLLLEGRLGGFQSRNLVLQFLQRRLFAEPRAPGVFAVAFPAALQTRGLVIVALGVTVVVFGMLVGGFVWFFFRRSTGAGSGTRIALEIRRRH